MVRALKIKLGRLGGRIELRQGHAVILGRSGSGKSNTAKVLVSEISKRGIPVLVLDWAGEYQIPGFTRLSPGEDLSLSIMGPYQSCDPETVDVIVDLFDAVFHLTPPQLFMLRTAVKYAMSKGFRGINGILEALEEVPIRSYYDHETKAALVRRISPMTEGRIARALNGYVVAESFFNKCFTVDLSVFKSIYAKKLFSLLLLKELYNAAIKRGIAEGVVHATLVEEAWNIIPYRRLDSEPTIGERMFAELRKYGECMIAVAQNPTEIAWSIINNAELLLIHAMLAREFESLGLDPVVLKRGDAIVIERGIVKLIHVRKFG
ncbi:MAG: DUF87 domain-containing protein [Thermofilaceae archaeon]